MPDDVQPQRFQKPTAGVTSGGEVTPLDQGAWGSEPLIEPTGQWNPAAPGATIIQWRAYFRTNHNAWLAFLAANPDEDVNYRRMTRANYLTALPFPGPRT